MINLNNIVSAALVALALAACGGGSSTLESRLSGLKAAGDVVSSTPLDASASIHVALVLKLNNEAELDSVLQQARPPGSATYGSVLTPTQISERFTPTAAQISRVTAYLQGHGFTNIKVAGNNMIVEADAPASLVSSVFQTKLVPVIMFDGSRTHINTDIETVPDEIRGSVQSALGLDTATRLHRHIIEVPGATSTTNNNATTSTTGSAVGHSPTAFPGIYAVSGSPTASWS